LRAPDNRVRSYGAAVPLSSRVAPDPSVVEGLSPTPTVGPSMIRTTLTTLAVSLSLVTGTARADDDEAKATAEKLLTAGARLFDAKDAKGLADTYTDDAVIIGLTREKDTRKIKTDVVRGRDAIEKTYRDLFKGDTTFHARNTVKHVHRVAPDVLV